jgi:FkbM family methyltransferase
MNERFSSSVRQGRTLLHLKSLLIGTRFERFAMHLRWLAGAKRRAATPELWEVYLEPRRLPQLLERLLRRNSNGVDVGCHVGSFLSLLQTISPDGHHTAIEAVPAKAALLRTRFPNVNIVPVAVGAVPGFATFEENLHEPGCSHLRDLRPPDQSSKLYEVEVKPLDDIISERVDFIKMDILGAELAALRGARATIEKWKPILLFECGSEHEMALAGLSRKELYEFVTTDLDYDLFSFTDFLFDKGKMTADEFRKSGMYPFTSFNYLGMPKSAA